MRRIFLLLNKIKLTPSQQRNFFLLLSKTKRKEIKKIILDKIGLSLRQKELFSQLSEKKWAEKELEKAQKENIEIIDFFSPFYPPLLKEIDCPPLVIYVKGEKQCLSKRCFAIVGTRLASLYGKMISEKIAFSLASLGLVIVSGLARGIDAYAHKGALKGGLTVAVLGSGLLNIYPKENLTLAEKIAEKGALISEFPLDEPPFKKNFPQRNRIISGLSEGVLVTEAPQRSGALITARFALEQNREVFALPGEAFSPLSKGTHLLIKEGAKLVDSLEDILEELNLSLKINSQSNFSLSSEERRIFDIIDRRKGISLEELILKSNLAREEVMKTVISLQMKSLIREVTPLCFVRAR